jgi:sterol-4alpha-carboxylate 3-dehydrogenase (decarboxylating)
MEKVYQKYLIIGGGGFLGRYIVEYLINRGEKFIKVFDIRKTFEDSKIEFIVGDITKIDDVINACKDINIVIHTASATHHGHNSNFMYNVNVEGTKNVINACLLQGVSKLIYTSSASVVFDGNNLFDVNEETPYAKYSLDPYSKTKELAEKLVIEANGKKGLMTCSLRPSGFFF